MYLCTSYENDKLILVLLVDRPEVRCRHGKFSVPIRVSLRTGLRITANEQYRVPDDIGFAFSRNFKRGHHCHLRHSGFSKLVRPSTLTVSSVVLVEVKHGPWHTITQSLKYNMPLSGSLHLVVSSDVSC
jgi:hypothetical protein